MSVYIQRVRNPTSTPAQGAPVHAIRPHRHHPTIVTPFTADGDVDEEAFRGVVRFMVKKKVHGICVGGSSGEGHTYTAEEFKRLNEIACEEVDGAIPVVAGIIVNSTRDAIARAASIAHLPIAGLQVTPVHYVFKPDEDATYAHFKALSEPRSSRSSSTTSCHGTTSARHCWFAS